LKTTLPRPPPSLIPTPDRLSLRSCLFRCCVIYFVSSQPWFRRWPRLLARKARRGADSLFPSFFLRDRPPFLWRFPRRFPRMIHFSSLCSGFSGFHTSGALDSVSSAVFKRFFRSSLGGAGPTFFKLSLFDGGEALTKRGYYALPISLCADTLFLPPFV